MRERLSDISVRDCSVLSRVIRGLFSALLLGAGTISGAGDLALADEPNAPQVPLKVEVRTIRAERLSLARVTGQMQTDVDIERSISDLNSQLRRLEFNKFRLVDEQALILPPRKRRKLALADGHQLAIRPVSMEGDVICLWLKWKDRNGKQILETRVRFVAGESMLTGTENSPDAGLILALKVEPFTGPQLQ